jgi:hypothetical protein
MSTISSVSPASTGLLSTIQQITDQDSSASVASGQVESGTNSTAQGPQGAQGHHHHHHGGGGGGGDGLFSQIETAVTSALQNAPAGSNANQTIQSAIASVLQNAQNNANSSSNSSQSSSTDSSSTPASTSPTATTPQPGGASQSSFQSLLQSVGVNAQQFHQDFQTAVQSLQQNGTVDFASLFHSFPAGSGVDTQG